MPVYGRHFSVVDECSGQKDDDRGKGRFDVLSATGGAVLGIQHSFQRLAGGAQGHADRHDAGE